VVRKAGIWYSNKPQNKVLSFRCGGGEPVSSRDVQKLSKFRRKKGGAASASEESKREREKPIASCRGEGLIVILLTWKVVHKMVNACCLIEGGKVLYIRRLKMKAAIAN